MSFMYLVLLYLKKDVGYFNSFTDYTSSLKFFKQHITEIECSFGS